MMLRAYNERAFHSPTAGNCARGMLRAMCTFTISIIFLSFVLIIDRYFNYCDACSGNLSRTERNC
jgi:hypothetical protein